MTESEPMNPDNNEPEQPSKTATKPRKMPHAMSREELIYTVTSMEKHIVRQQKALDSAQEVFAKMDGEMMATKVFTTAIVNKVGGEIKITDKDMMDVQGAQLNQFEQPETRSMLLKVSWPQPDLKPKSLIEVVEKPTNIITGPGNEN